jgi:hypothetical protein
MLRRPVISVRSSPMKQPEGGVDGTETVTNAGTDFDVFIGRYNLKRVMNLLGMKELMKAVQSPA